MKTEPKTLLESPKVKIKTLKYNDMPDDANDVRRQRAVGEVLSGGDDHNKGREIFQPEPDTEHGAQDARERKSESKVTEGHHVHAGGDPDGNRQAFVESEHSRNDSKVRGDSSRETLKDSLKSAKKL